ncbi:MAG: hypothetical protein ACFFG0_54545 [Candidatus Thorarchaeota archaeon]
MNKQIHIFDIDGCIVSDERKDGSHIFGGWEEPNRNYEEIAKYIEEKELYSDFINFFNILKLNKPYIYFLTGRIKSYFEDITIYQLHCLKYFFSICFYPDDDISQRGYLNFKLYKTLGIILEDKGESLIYIYDDVDDYFPRLKQILDICDLHNYILYKVDDPELFWSNQYKRIKIERNLL